MWRERRTGEGGPAESHPQDSEGPGQTRQRANLELECKYLTHVYLPIFIFTEPIIHTQNFPGCRIFLAGEIYF